MSDNHTRYPSRANGTGRLFLDFELLGAGAAAVTVGESATEEVASISRSATGVFVVTMKNAYTKVVAASASVDDTLDDGARATIGALTNEGTSTALVFTLRFRDASGTKADPAAARRIGVRLVLRNGNAWGQT